MLKLQTINKLNQRALTGARENIMNKSDFWIINPNKGNIPSVKINHQPNTTGRVQMIEKGVMAMDYVKGKALSINRN